MHAVSETKVFRSAAADAGMTLAEIDQFVDLVAADPTIGDVIQSTGGCRKVRFARPGAGKSGGYRIITFYTGPRIPVFLITVFGKGDKASLTKAERNALGKMTKVLVAEYGAGVVKGGGASK